MTLDFAIVAISCLVLVPEIAATTRIFDRVPHVGFTTWTALGVVGWASSIAVFLSWGVNPGHQSLVRAVGLFTEHLASGHPLRGLGMLEVVGLSLTLDVVVLFVAALITSSRVTLRHRREQRVVVDLLATATDSRGDVRLVDIAHPLAYFLPGGRGRVVISTGARAILDDAEYGAVLAHERGHRHGRHGHALVALQTVAGFVRFLPYSRRAPIVMRGYLEMMADDDATRSVARHDLRAALAKATRFNLAPNGTLAMGEVMIERRIERLSSRPRRAGDVVGSALIAAASLSAVAALVTAR